MPFDGTSYSPSFEIFDPTSNRRCIQQTMGRQRLPPRAVTEALDALIVPDMLERRLGQGRCWSARYYEDYRGRFCVMGALGCIRRCRGVGDRAGMFLRRAVFEAVGKCMTISRFNDTRQSYDQIRAVILRANELAQAVVDRWEPPSTAAFYPLAPIASASDNASTAEVTR
jgi:hypothetical protein